MYFVYLNYYIKIYMLKITTKQFSLIFCLKAKIVKRLSETPNCLETINLIIPHNTVNKKLHLIIIKKQNKYT